VEQDYQKTTIRTRTKAARRAEPAGEPVVPHVVNVVMGEIAADVREGLLAIAVGAGLQVLTAMMAAEVEALCGPRGKIISRSGSHVTGGPRHRHNAPNNGSAR